MVNFINSFLSYLMLLLVIVVCCAVGFFIGGFFRKGNSDKQVASVEHKGNDGEV